MHDVESKLKVLVVGDIALHCLLSDAFRRLAAAILMKNQVLASLVSSAPPHSDTYLIRAVIMTLMKPTIKSRVKIHHRLWAVVIHRPWGVRCSSIVRHRG